MIKTHGRPKCDFKECDRMKVKVLIVILIKKKHIKNTQATV